MRRPLRMCLASVSEKRLALYPYGFRWSDPDLRACLYSYGLTWSDDARQICPRRR